MNCDIADVKRRVLAVYPFFGSLMADLSFEETETIRTMGSDGKTIYYNPGYLEHLTSGGQTFALAHELCHIAFRHIRRGRGRDSEVWKNATDAVINQMLLRDGLEMIPGAVDDPQAIDYDAEQYYEILLQYKLEIELVEGSMQRLEDTGGSGGAGSGLGSDDELESNGDESGSELGSKENPGDDDHSMWEDAADREAEEEAEQEEKLRRELEKIRTLSENLFQLRDLEENEASGQDREQEENEEENTLLESRVAQAGNSPRQDTRDVGRIGAAPPIIDWRLLLRDTITYGVDWSFTNATLEDGIVRPALEERPMPETEIVLDTSWSVDDDLLRNFLRECRNILPLSKLKAGCFDTVFYGFQDIRTEEDIENMVFEGGGGTDFDTAAGAFSMRVDNRIIFTDGQAPMPQEPLNAIWMVYGDEEIAPPGGTVIHITPEQLARLSERR